MLSRAAVQHVKESVRKAGRAKCKEIFPRVEATQVLAGSLLLSAVATTHFATNSQQGLLIETALRKILFLS